MNFKRKRPRLRTRSWLVWWYRIFHRRLPRRKAKAVLQHSIASGSKEPIFDPPKKPHHYY